MYLAKRGECGRLAKAAVPQSAIVQLSARRNCPPPPPNSQVRLEHETTERRQEPGSRQITHGGLTAGLLVPHPAIRLFILRSPVKSDSFAQRRLQLQFSSLDAP